MPWHTGCAQAAQEIAHASGGQAMSATDDRIEEEIRNILASGEESTRGWSDQRIVAEASRRVGNGAVLRSTKPRCDAGER